MKWLMPVILELGRLRQAVASSLSYTVSSRPTCATGYVTQILIVLNKNLESDIME